MFTAEVHSMLGLCVCVLCVYVYICTYIKLFLKLKWSHFFLHWFLFCVFIANSVSAILLCTEIHPVTLVYRFFFLSLVLQPWPCSHPSPLIRTVGPEAAHSCDLGHSSAVTLTLAFPSLTLDCQFLAYAFPKAPPFSLKTVQND